MSVVVWDAKKAASNLVKHGIGFEEAQSVFFAQASITVDDPRHGENRFISIALSTKLNLLVVVYAYDLEDKIRIISARKATKKEVKIYEERI